MVLSSGGFVYARAPAQMACHVPLSPPVLPIHPDLFPRAESESAAEAACSTGGGGTQKSRSSRSDLQDAAAATLAAELLDSTPRCGACYKALPTTASAAEEKGGFAFHCGVCRFDMCKDCVNGGTVIVEGDTVKLDFEVAMAGGGGAPDAATLSHAAALLKTTAGAIASSAAAAAGAAAAAATATIGKVPGRTEEALARFEEMTKASPGHTSPDQDDEASYRVAVSAFMSGTGVVDGQNVVVFPHLTDPGLFIFPVVDDGYTKMVGWRIDASEDLPDEKPDGGGPWTTCGKCAKAVKPIPSVWNHWLCDHVGHCAPSSEPPGVVCEPFTRGDHVFGCATATSACTGGSASSAGSARRVGDRVDGGA